jgi:purine nucleosidase
VAAKRVILDTDIGTDVDDCLALALILASPELELAGVTVVHGNVLLRARMVLKLLELRGAQEIPVALGAVKPLLSMRPVCWAGYEGSGLLEPGDERLAPGKESAVELIVRTVMDNPGEITLIAIGPLTNIAAACLCEPRLAANLASLVIMGGVVGGAHALALPWAEHNFKCDPEAADVVLSAGAPVIIVPLDVTTRVRITEEGVARIRAAGDPFHQAVAEQVKLYPRFAVRGWTNLHDPLAVMAAIDPALLSLEPLHVLIETQGQHTAGEMLVSLPSSECPANAFVALSVEARRSEDAIVGRIGRP